MAITDYGNFLSCKQVLDEEKISYATKYIDFMASNDIGQTALPLFVKIICHGAFTKALKIDLMMANKKDFTDAVSVSSLDVAQSALTRGWNSFISIPATGKKFRYLSLKYTPTGATVENTAKAGSMCPSEPVLYEDKEIQKALSAFVVTVNDFNTIYPIND